MTTRTNESTETPRTGPPSDPSLAQRFADARRRADIAVRQGGDGISVARQFAADVTVILRDLAEPQLARCKIPIAIFATGGFGRHELAPFSDLDLLFLCAEVPGDEVSALAEAVLYPLWDAKVDAGHAVRSFDQALALPETELAAATALLDARFLFGDRALGERFLRAFLERIETSAAEDFVARLRAEQKARHGRFGDTIYLLEPDLKNGPGGMRDLCAGRWAAMARFGTADPRELVAKGVMTERLAAAFVAALEWLLRVRIGIHSVAGRRQDQLRFAWQEAVAPIFCGDARDTQGVIRPAVAPAVEALMHQFHGHAKLVRRETERLLQRAALRPDHEPTTAPVLLGGSDDPDRAFVLQDGGLDAVDDDLFDRRPSEMLRIFSAAIELNVPIALGTREKIAEHAATRAEELRADPLSGRRFIDVLTDTRDRATPTRLEEMQDLGLLGALIPEWEPSTGRVQHDIYHVYTVDQHALYAVARMHALARGDLAEAFPLFTEIIREVDRPVALMAGTFLHDIGKPYGSPHSDKGADMTMAIARRLGLEEEDARRAEFLVRQHLVMGIMSQRRDIEDVGMIEDFAKLCGDEENLRELTLLTFCDLSSVAPDNLTGWKEALLREFYERTLAFMRRGPDLLGVERAGTVERRQRHAAKILGEEPGAPELTALFQGLPDRYFVENPSRAIALHVRLIRERRACNGRAVLDVSHDPALGVSQMVLVADDIPGLLAEVTGVLHANRIDVVDAAIYSRDPEPGDKHGEAIDIFRVRDAYGKAVTAEDRWTKIRADIESVLSGRLRVEDLASSRSSSGSVAAWRTPQVPTELKIDNDVSRDFTVVEVVTEDRPGVLFAITRTLFDQGLDIHRSKIATEANRAVDVFYVRDEATGQKLVDGERISALRGVLLGSLPRS